jgi:hypothetical protein
MQPLITAGRYSHAAGSAISSTATVTVPNGATVTGLMCLAKTADGSLVITPGGANQTGSAQPSIPIPQGTGFEPPAQSMFQQLGGGTTFVFTNVDSYLVTYNKPIVGA